MVKRNYDKLTLDNLTSRSEDKFLKRAQEDPLWWIRNVLGVKKLWWGQEQIIADFIKHDKIVVKSGHGLGKDYLGGALALYYLCCFPPVTVITTATTERQVNLVMWGEISKLYANAAKPLGGKLLTTDLIMTEKKDVKWLATGFTTKDTNENVGKFQGFHNDHVLVIVSEAQAIEPAIMEQIDSLMVGGNCKLLLIGNPLAPVGPFYDAFQDKSFKKYTFSCYESPNVKSGKEIIPGMVGRRWVKEKEEKWGIDSPLFQSRVMGEFPKSSTNSFLSLADITESLTTLEPKLGPKVLAIDPARYGNDKTAIAFAVGGDLRYLSTTHGKATTETEGLIITLIKKLKPDVVRIDEGAMGAGIFDHLLEEQVALEKQGFEFEVEAFNFGGRATDSLFANLGAESYFSVCKSITEGDVKLLENDSLMAQLSSRRYTHNSKGKLMLERKEDVKKRGLPSPDEADAVIMALHRGLDEDYIPEDERPDEDDDEVEDEMSELFDEKTGYRR